MVRNIWFKIGIAAIIGILAWNTIHEFLILSIFFIPLWMHSESRLEAYLVALSYYLGASNGLILGSSQYFSSPIYHGFGLWIGANALIATVFYLTWTANRNYRFLSLIGAVFILSLPPVGVFGWANPLTASGLLFPGLGFTGIFLTFILALSLSNLVPFPRLTAISLTLAGTVSQFYSKSPQPPKNWRSMETNFNLIDKNNPLGRFVKNGDLIDFANNSTSPTILFGEALFESSNANKQYWKNKLRPGVDVFIGATQNQENTIVKINKESVETLYSQRQPMPLGMWNPFLESSFKARWFDQPSINYDQMTVAPFICYESFLIWPILHSMIYEPDLIVSIGSLWWARNTKALTTYRNIVNSWSRLFSVPALIAINR